MQVRQGVYGEMQGGAVADLTRHLGAIFLFPSRH